MTQRARYGVDGYRYLVGLALIALGLGVLAGVLGAAGWRAAAWFAGVAAMLVSIADLLGLHYVLRGKLVHRDRVLSAIPWRGDEAVLDVGTGAGLLMIGAAKRAPRGISTGIDIWRAEDLTSNSEARARSNAVIEGVADRIVIRNEDVRALSMTAESIDVVVSCLCLHNIDERRAQALDRIASVVKRGGYVVISDLAHVSDYAAHLRARGFSVEEHGPELSTFPPQRWLVARRT